MSEAQIVFTAFSSKPKNQAVVIEASGPDFETASVTIEDDEIFFFYQLTPAQFISRYGEDANILAEVFTAIKGIKISETV